MKRKVNLLLILAWCCIAEAIFGGGLYLYNYVVHHIPFPPGEITAHAAFAAIGVIATIIAGTLNDLAGVGGTNLNRQ